MSKHSSGPCQVIKKTSPAHYVAIAVKCALVRSGYQSKDSLNRAHLSSARMRSSREAFGAQRSILTSSLSVSNVVSFTLRENTALRAHFAGQTGLIGAAPLQQLQSTQRRLPMLACEGSTSCRQDPQSTVPVASELCRNVIYTASMCTREHAAHGVQSMKCIRLQSRSSAGLCHALDVVGTLAGIGEDDAVRLHSQRHHRRHLRRRRAVEAGSQLRQHAQQADIACESESQAQATACGCDGKVAHAWDPWDP